MNRLSLLAALAALLTSVAFGAPGVARAHEHRDVGEYSIVVGFLNEPALVGEPNGLDLRVSRHTETPSGADEHAAGEEGHSDEEEAGTPVEGLEKTLQAEVIVGGGAQTLPLELEPRFGQPGAYVAHFIPTRAGDYSFRIFGAIDGMEIDERFDSGPETFSPVLDVADLQFPEKVPGAAALQDAVDQLDSRVTALESSGSGSTRENVALGLGAAGLIAGLAGLGAAGLALMRSRA